MARIMPSLRSPPACRHSTRSSKRPSSISHPWEVLRPCAADLIALQHLLTTRYARRSMNAHQAICTMLLSGSSKAVVNGDVLLGFTR